MGTHWRHEAMRNVTQYTRTQPAKILQMRRGVLSGKIRRYRARIDSFAREMAAR